jgi:hypothetical protein
MGKKITKTLHSSQLQISVNSDVVKRVLIGWSELTVANVNKFGSADFACIFWFNKYGVVASSNRQTSGESASLPQYLGCNTVFDMRLRVTFLRRKTVSLQTNIAHRE